MTKIPVRFKSKADEAVAVWLGNGLSEFQKIRDKPTFVELSVDNHSDAKEVDIMEEVYFGTVNGREMWDKLWVLPNQIDFSIETEYRSIKAGPDSIPFENHPDYKGPRGLDVHVTQKVSWFRLVRGKSKVASSWDNEWLLTRVITNKYDPKSVNKRYNLVDPPNYRTAAGIECRTLSNSKERTIISCRDLKLVLVLKHLDKDKWTNARLTSSIEIIGHDAGDWRDPGIDEDEVPGVMDGWPTVNIPETATWDVVTWDDKNSEVTFLLKKPNYTIEHKPFGVSLFENVAPSLLSYDPRYVLLSEPGSGSKLEIFEGLSREDRDYEQLHSHASQLIKRGLKHSPIETGMSSAHSALTYSETSFLEAWNVGVEVSFGGEKDDKQSNSKFGGSLGYSHAEAKGQTYQESAYQMVMSQAKSIFQIDVDPVMLPLTKNFRDRIARLPSNIKILDRDGSFGSDDAFLASTEAKLFKEFVNDFGTHFAKRIVYGGRRYALQNFQSEAVAELRSVENKFSASGKFPIKGVPVNIKLEGGHATTENSTTGTEMQQSSWRYFGGQGDGDGISVDENNAQPIEIYFEPLYTLVNRAVFGIEENANALKVKERALRAVINACSVAPEEVDIGDPVVIREFELVALSFKSAEKRPVFGDILLRREADLLDAFDAAGEFSPDEVRPMLRSLSDDSHANEDTKTVEKIVWSRKAAADIAIVEPDNSRWRIGSMGTPSAREPFKRAEGVRTILPIGQKPMDVTIDSQLYKVPSNNWSDKKKLSVGTFSIAFPQVDTEDVGSFVWTEGSVKYGGVRFFYRTRVTPTWMILPEHWNFLRKVARSRQRQAET